MGSEPLSFASRTCRRCGAPLAPDAPGSACWSCMLDAGSPSSPGTGAPDSTSPDNPAVASKSPVAGDESAKTVAAVQPAPVASDLQLVPVEDLEENGVGQTIGCYKLREKLGEG